VCQIALKVTDYKAELTIYLAPTAALATAD